MAAPDFTSRLELSKEAFQIWWDQLAHEDREEFKFIYGGDDYHARFVCAMDYLTIQKIPFDTLENMFVTAYWLAAVFFEPQLTIDNPALRNRAIRAWKSDAVQTLFDRVRYRSVRQGSITIQNKLFELGKMMAEAAMQEDVPLKDQKAAADTLVRIVQLVDQQEQAVRADRTKRGLDRAREALAGALPDAMSDRDLTVLLKAAKTQLGEDKVLALMSSE